MDGYHNICEKKYMCHFYYTRHTLCTTGGPLDMRILGLVKTRISGKSHIENQKAVIPYVHDFALICEKKNHICSCLFTH